MVLFIISAILAVGMTIYTAYQLSTFIKNPLAKPNYFSFFKKEGISALISTLLWCLLFASINVWMNDGTTIGEWAITIIFGLLFPAFTFLCVITFVLHYYKKEIPQDIDNWLFRILLISFVGAIISLLALTNAYADHIEYPLINGFNFEYGVSYPASMYGNGSSSQIAFYAICILSGALYSYLICDHQFYKEYGKHGMLDSVLIFGLISGIIGARIFYVIGEWENYVNAANPFIAMISIHEGGLTILGGAPTGIVVGGLVYKLQHKNKSVLHALDIMVPSILVAQAIGRWGNFFNLEVHGNEVPIENWAWLPKFIINNSMYSSVAGPASEGNIYLPLFLIEGVINVFGFFLLRHLFGNKLKDYIEEGDLLFAYIAWYGLTRVLLEPLRYSSFNMGDNGYWSWFWSFIFVVAGILAIVVNHFVRYFIKKKKNEDIIIKDNSKKVGLITGALFLLLAIALIVLAIINMTSSTFTPDISYNKFNVGLICLSLGISSLLALSVSVLTYVKGLKKEKETQNA